MKNSSEAERKRKTRCWDYQLHEWNESECEYEIIRLKKSISSYKWTNTKLRNKLWRTHQKQREKEKQDVETINYMNGTSTDYVSM